MLQNQIHKNPVLAKVGRLKFYFLPSTNVHPMIVSFSQKIFDHIGNSITLLGSVTTQTQ